MADQIAIALIAELDTFRQRNIGRVNFEILNIIGGIVADLCGAPSRKDTKERHQQNERYFGKTGIAVIALISVLYDRRSRARALGHKQHDQKHTHDKNI